MRRSFLLVLLTLLARPAAADDRLFVRPWTELEPLVRIEAEYPIPVEKAQKKLLEEARVLLSGMVYGWRFLYTPADRERRIEEIFDLAPVAEIPWGSPRLEVRETEIVATKLYARVSYTMTGDELARRSAWSATTAARSTGRGSASVFRVPDQKMDALRAAIREAVRAHLNSRVLNKPREIRGEVLLWDDPSTIVRAGAYTTTAHVKLQVSEILPYSIF